MGHLLWQQPDRKQSLVIRLWLFIPDDKRYQKWIGKEIEVEGLIGKFKVIVVADWAVDPKFGTGAVKVTPAHDFNDYEIAKRHNLPMKQGDRILTVS